MRSMKSSIGLLGVFAALAVLVLIAGLVLYGSSGGKTEHGIDVALDLARLEPLPTGATIESVQVTSNPVTREFVIVFTAPIADIEAWLAASTGTKDVTPTTKGTTEHYQIGPSGEAQVAEVRVERVNRRVTIRTYRF